MKCWKCGNEYSGNFCPVCGEKAVVHSARPAPRKRKSKKAWYKKWWVWCIAAVFLVFICVPKNNDASTVGGDQTAAAPTLAPAASPEPSQAAIPSVDPTLAPMATVAEATEAPTPEPTADPTPEPIMGYISARSLNLRATPGTDGDIVKECSGGQAVEIVGEDGDWYKVVVAGATGYMLKEYVSLGAAPDTAAAPVEQPQTEPDPAQTAAAPQEIPHSENYHGHVYASPSGEKYHYEADCAGVNSVEITWDQVSRRHLDPCGTCVLK